MNRFVKTVSTVVLLIALAGVPLFARGGQSSSGTAKKEVTYMTWNDGSGGWAAVMREYIERFNATNQDNITIIPEFIHSEQSKITLPTRMAAGEEPDIFDAWAGDYLRSYYETKKLLDVSAAYNGDPAFKAQFSEYAIQALTYPDGKIYGFPHKVTADFSFINKKILDKYGIPIPLYYSEYIEAARKLKAADPSLVPIEFGNRDAWPMASYSEMVVDRLGGSSVIPDVMAGRRSWTDPVFVDAMNSMKEMLPYIPDGFNAFNMDDSINNFIAGKSAIIINGGWLVESILREDSTVKDDIVVQPHPLYQNGKGNSKALLGQTSQNIILSASTKQPDAAIAFVKGFYTTEWVQKCIENGMIPPFKANLVDTSKMHPYTRRVFELISEGPTVQLYYDLQFGPVVGVEYNNVVQGVMSGNDPKTAFERFDQFYKQNYTLLK
jgi:ABC-type glycerol-3-phosphate transport system substrate-binding protein